MYFGRRDIGLIPQKLYRNGGGGIKTLVKDVNKENSSSE